MKILIIQHSAADFPATAGEVIERLGHSVETIRIDREDAVPGSADADALMMFGGGISLTSPELPPWVAQEQSLIRSYVSEGRRVLGICLGSQILASALGANVRRNRHAEIGWHQIERVDGAQASGVASVLPERMTVLQWHQDTFDIPPGARRLFKSEACDNQAFTIDDRVFGFQFHIEANPKTVSTFLAVSSHWKQEGPFTQSEAEINQGLETYLPTQAEILERFLESWLPAR
jgi:GMP synthase-like glutamine amidotransferase